LESKNEKDLKQAWYAFVPSSGSRQNRNKRSGIFKYISGVLVLAFFISAFFFPPKDNPNKIDRKAPDCDIYPITTEKDISGVIRFFETDKIVSAKYSVWEKTQGRMLYAAALSKEDIDSGNFTIPTMSFWDDYVVHFTEYTGFGKKGDYKQEVRVTLNYDPGNGEIKTKAFASDPVEASICWMQMATKNHGSRLVMDGYITEIIHSMHLTNDVRECYVEQPERVRKSDIISVRVTIDGKPVPQKPHIEKVSTGLTVVRVAVPEGMEKDGTHTIEIYLTQYITEFKEALEFLTIDTY